MRRAPTLIAPRSPLLSALALVMTAALGGCSDPEDKHCDDLASSSLACVPDDVPASLAVPDARAFAFSYAADGTQNYACTRASDGPYAWVLEAPEAALTSAEGKPAGTHYKGPTWEHVDGSKVVATKRAEATPDTTAIPWLLLEVSAREGRGRLADITHIQRIETVGGLSPRAPCTADNLGEARKVPYTAIYAFYR